MNNPLFPLMGISRLRMATDGSGVTTLVAAYGCPLRCKYCLNPQCFNPDFKPLHITPEELLAKVRIDNLYFQATGGGITFGGGEPLLHADFIHAFAKISPKSWKLRAETCLNVPTDMVKLAVSCLDEIIIDVKDLNPEIYKAYTGKESNLVHANLSYLSANYPVKNVLIRIPSIPAYNTETDTDNSIQKLKEMGFVRFDTFTYRTSKA